MPVKLRRLTHNWRLKLLALGLSVFLWALVQNEPNLETLPSVPVRVEVADTMWTTAGPPSPATVQLRLAGPAGEMVHLPRLGPTVVVPVTAIGPLDTTISLRHDWVELGEGTRLSVEDISPSVVRVSFERAVTRAVPASVHFSGRLGAHLAFAAPVSLNPRMIRLHGPGSRVASLDSVPLFPLDLSTVTASGVFTVGVDTSALPGIRATPRTTSVTLQVEDEIERVLPAVPVEVDSSVDGATLTVQPSSVRVTLSGARTLVTSVDPSDLHVRVVGSDLRGMAPGEERHVPLHVDGVPALVSAMPDQAMATVRRPAKVRKGRAPVEGTGRR